MNINMKNGYNLTLYQGTIEFSNLTGQNVLINFQYSCVADAHTTDA